MNYQAELDRWLERAAPAVVALQGIALNADLHTDGGYGNLGDGCLHIQRMHRHIGLQTDGTVREIDCHLPEIPSPVTDRLFYPLLIAAEQLQAGSGCWGGGADSGDVLALVNVARAAVYDKFGEFGLVLALYVRFALAGNYVRFHSEINAHLRIFYFVGTYFELNGKRIFLSDDELAAAAREGGEFVVDIAPTQSSIRFRLAVIPPRSLRE